MTEKTYPASHEFCQSAPVLARKAIIKAYEEKANISEVARLFPTTRKTVRFVLLKELFGRGLNGHEEFLRDQVRRGKSLCYVLNLALNEGTRTNESAIILRTSDHDPGCDYHCHNRFPQQVHRLRPGSALILMSAEF